MKKPSKAAAELDASIKAEMEDISDWSTFLCSVETLKSHARFYDREHLTLLPSTALTQPQPCPMGIGCQEW
jgi:hypothetical protein